MQSVVFLGSKSVGLECFKLLLGSCTKLQIDIVGVGVSPRGRDIRELATAEQLNVFEEPQDIPECDIIISVQYHKILSSEQIAKAKKLAVNLHMAPLPEYRGCNQFSFAILNGDARFGTTLHVMNEGVDSGDILFEERFSIASDIWVSELYKETVRKSIELFDRNLIGLIAGDYVARPQQELEEKRGTSIHYRDEIAPLKEIDLSWDREKIEKHIRATYMPGFELPFSVVGGKKVYFSLGDLS